ncbi:MAG: hypothetical protein JXA57_19550 [Armatimonadetes bacterium]|nr:hypothetical protein [Armatimonadota bacterium]
MKWARIIYVVRPACRTWLSDAASYRYVASDARGSRVTVTKGPDGAVSLHIAPWFGPAVEVETMLSRSARRAKGLRIALQWDSPYYSVSLGNRLVRRVRNADLARVADLALPYGVYKTLTAKQLYAATRAPEVCDMWELNEVPRMLERTYGLAATARSFHVPSNATQKAREVWCVWHYAHALYQATRTKCHVAICVPRVDCGVDAYLRVLYPGTKGPDFVPIQVTEAHISPAMGADTDRMIYEAVRDSKLTPVSNNGATLVFQVISPARGCLVLRRLRDLFQAVSTWPYKNIVCLYGHEEGYNVATLYCSVMANHFWVKHFTDGRNEVCLGFSNADIEKRAQAVRERPQEAILRF